MSSGHDGGSGTSWMTHGSSPNPRSLRFYFFPVYVNFNTVSGQTDRIYSNIYGDRVRYPIDHISLRTPLSSTRVSCASSILPILPFPHGPSPLSSTVPSHRSLVPRVLKPLPVTIVRVQDRSDVKGLNNLMSYKWR